MFHWAINSVKWNSISKWKHTFRFVNLFYNHIASIWVGEVSKDARGDKSQTALVFSRNKGIIKRHFCSRILRKVIEKNLFIFISFYYWTLISYKPDIGIRLLEISRKKPQIGCNKKQLKKLQKWNKLIYFLASKDIL